MAEDNPPLGLDALRVAIDRIRNANLDLPLFAPLRVPRGGLKYTPTTSIGKDTDMATATETQFISIERARQCINRPVNVHNPDNLDEILYNDGTIAQVGQTFVKVARVNDDGIVEVNVVMPERISWREILPKAIRKGVGTNNDASASDYDGSEWSYESHNRTFTLEIKHDTFTEGYWQTHFVVSPGDEENYGPGDHLPWVHVSHENSNIHVASEIEELKGWAQP